MAPATIGVFVTDSQFHPPSGTPYGIVIEQCYGSIVRVMTNTIQLLHLIIIDLAGWLSHLALHFTTVNFGTTGVSNKSIVCLNLSFLTNAAYAFSVFLTDA